MSAFTGKIVRHTAMTALAAAACLPFTAQAAQTVATTVGTFTAVASPTNPDVDVFFGIRYAASPAGEARWTPPGAPTPPAGTVVASTPGDACPQPIPVGIAQSEDCLFLNVWTPANAKPDAKLPVFFWIHGGALIFGTGASFDPSAIIAESNVIVVTINYRLGALGFLAEPGLASATPSFFENIGDAGNYGLMDQQFALQWVRENIAQFGGDPEQVTIGGESAGGLSVTSQLTSINTAGGLFRGAIIESGPYMLHDLPSQVTYETLFGATFDKDAGCTSTGEAACLRGLSADAIVAAQDAAFGASGIAPDFGTKILPNSLVGALGSGTFLKVPVLQGTNANEGRLFEPALIPSTTGVSPVAVAAAGGPANFDLGNANAFCATGGVDAVCSFSQEINLFLGDLGLVAPINSKSLDTLVADEYPLANFPDPFLANDAPSSDEALSQIFTDFVFACNGLDSNTLLAQAVPVFAYEFDDPQAPPSAGSNTAIKAPNDVDGFPSASEHASELAFLFTLTGQEFTLSADEQQLAGEMKTYWGNFVAHLNPNLPASANSAAVPTWLLFRGANAPVQNLVPGPNEPAPFTTFATEHFCGTWNPLIDLEPQE
jgi:para-nitrobenzyl esterase